MYFVCQKYDNIDSKESYAGIAQLKQGGRQTNAVRRHRNTTGCKNSTPTMPSKELRRTLVPWRRRRRNGCDFAI